EPALGLHRAREGAALVAEELRLQELLGQRGAVHRDERLGGPRAVRVHGPRDQLLARARLAADEDVGVRPRRLADELEDPRHRRAPPDDVLEPERALELALEVHVLELELPRAEPALDRHTELV